MPNPALRPYRLEVPAPWHEVLMRLLGGVAELPAHRETESEEAFAMRLEAIAADAAKILDGTVTI